jgi:hypothetical protein
MVLTAWYLLKRGRAGSVFAWVGAAAGLILIGSGANTLLQMLVANYGAFGGAELLITLTFVLLTITLGAIALSISLRNSNRANVIKRVALVVIGVVALFVLAGLFVGPILAIAAAFMPTRLARLSSTQ